jgi:hypothetical protein
MKSCLEQWFTFRRFSSFGPGSSGRDSGENEVSQCHMRLPTRKPTPSEYVVLACVASLALIVLGLVAVVVAARVPAEKAELAAAIMHRGFWSLGIGLAIAIVSLLCRRLTG